MTPEQQRVKIAEACGWRITATIKYSWVVVSPLNMEVAWSSQGGELNDKPASFYLPDYLNDLNAMHEAEKVLLPDDAAYSQRNFYASELGRITGNDNGQGWKPLSNDDCFNILHATAAQRADAFLKTLGLWEETK